MKRRLRWLIGIVILGGLITGFSSLPQFAIRDLRFSGNNFLPDSRLKMACQTMVGKNILCVFFLHGFKQNLLKAFPEMTAIKFRIASPTSVRVVVREKEAWASFVTSEGNYLVAADGTILNRFSESPMLSHLERLIIIRGVPTAAFKGSFVNQRVLEKVQLVVNNIRLYLPLTNLQIEFSGENDIALIKDDRLPIRLGSLEYLDLKFRHLKYFLKNYGNDPAGFEYIDLRVEDRIVVKHAKSTTR